MTPSPDTRDLPACAAPTRNPARRKGTLDARRMRSGAAVARPRVADAPPASARRPEVEPELMWKTLGLLYLAGATIGLVSLAVPHSGANDGALLVNIGIAYAASVAALGLRRRLPAALLHVAVAAGTLIVSRAVYYAGGGASYYAVWYLWVGLYAWYFFRRLEAILHVGLVAVAYGVVLVIEPSSAPVARWLTTVSTLAIAGVFVDALVRRVRREARESARNAADLATIGAAVQRAARVEDDGSALAVLLGAALETSGAARATLFRPLGPGAELIEVATGGRDTGGFASHALAAGAGLAFTTGEQQHDPQALWQPVAQDGRPAAVIGLYWDDRTRPASPRIATLVGLVGEEVASLLQRSELLARLELAARTDDLVGLPNRRAWEEELPRQLARAGRQRRPLTVAMLDIDHFKRFNDSQGHQAGDELLKETPRAWRGELREGDVLARLGGDEFAALLADCGLDEAQTLVDRLRVATPSGHTCSCGLAEWDGVESAVALIARADAALYEAKRGGRDRTVAAA